MTKQRVALVTGGGSGMGEAVCLRLAAEGKCVAILDINIDNAERVVGAIAAAGGTAMAVQASIAEREQVEAAVGAVQKQFGVIDILVNCAGVEDFSPFDEIDSASWNRMLDINLTGNFNVTQVVLPGMKAQEWGRIVNFASAAAQIGAAHMVHYAAAKGGIVAMTRSLALEVGRFGITVNAIAPGLIDTAMARRAIDTGQFPIPVEQIVSSYPIPRMGSADEAAVAVVFFASEGASYITAQLLGVNGGTAV